MREVEKMETHTGNFPLLVIDDEKDTFLGISSDIAGIIETNGTKIVNVSTDIVKANLEKVISETFKILDCVEGLSHNYEVEELELNLGIDAEGQVSVFTALTANSNVSTSMKLKIKKKKE